MELMDDLKKKIERRKKFQGDGPDWLGYAIVISIVLVGGFFILSQIDAFNIQNDAEEQQARMISEYKKNLADPDNTPEAVYKRARQALLNNDLEGVLETIHPDAMWKYEDGLREAAAEGRLPEAGKRLTPLKERVSEYGEFIKVVRYTIEPIPGNEDLDLLEGYSESVEFTRNKKGIWKISSI
ncbi:MAG: hypothetical protein R3251_00670 [Candidatus Spechtbacterales bacterium]|nr:hypothetical protein [Candidatus Spechtbacterales bacterium]